MSISKEDMKEQQENSDSKVEYYNTGIQTNSLQFNNTKEFYQEQHVEDVKIGSHKRSLLFQKDFKIKKLHTSSYSDVHCEEEYSTVLEGNCFHEEQADFSKIQTFHQEDSKQNEKYCDNLKITIDKNNISQSIITNNPSICPLNKRNNPFSPQPSSSSSSDSSSDLSEQIEHQKRFNNNPHSLDQTSSYASKFDENKRYPRRIGRGSSGIHGQNFQRSKEYDRNQNCDQSCIYRQSGMNQKRRASSRRQVLSPKQIWAKKAFLIIMFVNSLLFRLKKVLIFSRPQLLNTLQLNLINDKSARDIGKGWGTNGVQIKEIQKKLTKVQANTWFQRQKKQFLKSLKKRFKKWNLANSFEILQVIKKLGGIVPVFDPLSKPIFVWESTIFLLTVVNFFIIPLDYSFIIFTSGLSNLYFKQICLVVFVTDILIRFNTSFYHRGCLVQERQKIFTNYFFSQFVLDLVTSMSLAYQVFSYSGTYLLFFLRIFYFSKIIDKFMESVMLNSKVSGTLQLLLLLLQVQFLCHIFTCFWHLIGQYSVENNELSWMTKRIAQSGGWVYLDSYYFCIITMTTIGFGDIVPLSFFEKMFVCGMSVISSVVMGYSVNSIGNILGEMKKQKESFQQRLAGVNEYMRNHSVNPQLQSKTRKYLEYVSSEGIDKYHQPERNLEHISKYLREEILKDVFVKSINLIPFFRDNCSSQFKEKLALRMREQVYGPDEIIDKKGNKEVPRIQIVAKGEVELFWELGKTIIQEKKIKHLNEGQAFGFFEFFTGDYCTQISAKSLGVSRIQLIQLDDFLDLLSEFEEEKEAFCFVRDSILLNKEFNLIQKPCFSCGRNDHFISDCPFLFYDSHKLPIIKTYNKSFIEMRKNFTRNIMRFRFPSLSRANNIALEIIDFREKQISLDSNEEYNSDSEGQNEENLPEDSNHDLTISDYVQKKGDIKEKYIDSKKGQDFTESNLNEEDNSQENTMRKKIRSLSAKNQRSTQQIPPSNPRVSILGEDLAQQLSQYQPKSRKSVLLSVLEEKVANSQQSMNKMPSLGSRGNWPSSMAEIVTQNLTKTKDQLQTRQQQQFSQQLTQYGKMTTTNEGEFTQFEKSKNRVDPLLFLQSILSQHFINQKQFENQGGSQSLDFISDKVCSYKVYFPSGNIKNVIAELEKFKKKSRQRPSQKQQSSRRTGLNKGLITLKQLNTLKTMFADQYAAEPSPPQTIRGEQYYFPDNP